MIKENWVIDCNHFEPMLNGSNIIIRDNHDGDNGIGDKLMMVGFNQINNDIEAGIPEEFAGIICSAPKMFNAIKTIIEGVSNYNRTDLDWIVKTLKESIKYINEIPE